jgi:hypothetical protein
MIGAFARMLGARERLLAVEPTEDQQGYATSAQAPGGVPTRREARDAPPEGFVEKVTDDGGDVYMVPMLEALRDWVRRRRGLAGADADPAPLHRKETLPELSEKR